jgi:Tol biopolymer transport system component
LVSQDTFGNVGNGASSNPTISADGSFVAFTSASSNLTLDPDPAPSQIFLRDTVGNGTSLVSKDNSLAPGGGLSDTPSVNADGRFVAFMSTSANLVTSVSGQQIYVRAMP